MFCIGIVGTRSRDTADDYAIVERVFNLIKGGERIHDERVMVVSGGCKFGGDRFAEIIARKYQESITIHYAKWDYIGKSAGYKRNGLIADGSDYLIACVSKDRKGGTEDTINKFIDRHDGDTGNLTIV